MYSKLPNLTIGFHGCDFAVYEEVLLKHKPMQKSKNSYDWLGNGIYFWENSYGRALDWARSSKKIKNPAVIGAVIDFGYCLNLSDYSSSDVLKRGYEILSVKNELLGVKMPYNKTVPGGNDLLLRNLDCAVIQQIHSYHNESKKPDYDTVRGIFVEGGAVYSGSGFREKTHVQICVVNPNCIKGLFDPMQLNEAFPNP